MQSTKSELLIIFTRYPEAGKTKTRLIPVLGAEGAAKLQRQLTEFTLKTANKLVQKRNISIVIYFTGGNQDLFKTWLGKDLEYYVQCEGDLGNRMYDAFKNSFKNNITKIVLIGVDCPELTSEILTQAFTLLNQKDLVLGPAKDGGYYLIGLKSAIPELFKNIAWGSNTVFSETVKIAANLGLNCGYLPTLSDLDRPEDLELILSENKSEIFLVSSDKTLITRKILNFWLS